VRRLSNGTNNNGNNGNNGNNSNNLNVEHQSIKTAGTKLVKASDDINDDQELPRNVKKHNHTTNTHGIPYDNIMEQNTSNIDTIFIKITDLYTQDDFDIIYHTLMKLQQDPQYYMNYVDGLNKIMEPVNIRIKKWIDDNIIF